MSRETSRPKARLGSLVGFIDFILVIQVLFAVQFSYILSAKDIVYIKWIIIPSLLIMNLANKKKILVISRPRPISRLNQ